MDKRGLRDFLGEFLPHRVLLVSVDLIGDSLGVEKKLDKYFLYDNLDIGFQYHHFRGLL